MKPATGRIRTLIPFHLWVALSNWSARAVVGVVQLVTIPMLTRALGTEQFAAYAVLVSLLGWFTLLDLGLGSALQNFISEARAQGQQANGHIAAVGLASVGIVCLGSALVILFSPFLARFLFAQMPFVSPQMGKILVSITGLFFICNAVGTIGIKMLYALGRGIYANLITIIVNLLSLGLLWSVVTYVNQESMLFAGIVAYAAPLGLIGLSVTTIIFIKYGRWNKRAVVDATRQIIPRARGFWLFALLAAGVLNVDYLVMSQTLSSEDIAKYNILARIFGAGISLYSGLLVATWPIWTEFAVGKEWGKVNRHLRIYLNVALGVLCVLTVVMILVLPSLLTFFLPGKDTVITLTTILLFSLYIGFRIWADTYAVILQAVNETNIFLRWVPVQAAISISAQWLLSLHFGLDGILLGLILSFLLTVVWVLPKRLHAYVESVYKMAVG